MAGKFQKSPFAGDLMTRRISAGCSNGNLAVRRGTIVAASFHPAHKTSRPAIASSALRRRPPPTKGSVPTFGISVPGNAFNPRYRLSKKPCDMPQPPKPFHTVFQKAPGNTLLRTFVNHIFTIKINQILIANNTMPQVAWVVLPVCGPSGPGLSRTARHPLNWRFTRLGICLMAMGFLQYGPIRCLINKRQHRQHFGEMNE